MFPKSPVLQKPTVIYASSKTFAISENSKLPLFKVQPFLLREKKLCSVLSNIWSSQMGSVPYKVKP